VKRLVGTTAIALIALTGCSGGSKDASAPSASLSASSGASTTGSACTSETAKPARQVLVSAMGFDATCVKAAVGKQVFFINNGDKAQSLKTAAGSPESFKVDLPKKTSTYARAFKKKGTYVIEQAGGKTSLTLIVV
jgi:plastocyanin